MPVVAPPTLTAPPTLPDRNDAATFITRAFAQDDFRKNVEKAEYAALALNVANNATDAFNSAGASATSREEAAAAAAASAASASLAAGAASAPVWTAKNYTQGDRTSSPANGRLYRRTPAGTTASATDPSLDAAGWAVINNGFVYVPVTGASATAQSGCQYGLLNVALTTITAPAAPTAGDTFQVVVCNGLETNVINWNGSKYETFSDATMPMDAVRVWTFTYINAGFGWKVY